MSKYEPLAQFLMAREENSLSLSFEQIESMIGCGLPASASKYEAWWSNNDTGHSHARAWMGVGWRTAEVDLTGRRVSFRRMKAATGRKSDPWGCMAGTITIMPGTDLTEPSGEVWNAEEGLLVDE